MKMDLHKRKTRILPHLLALFLISFGLGSGLFSQTMPEVMEKGSFEEQKKYMEEKTNIYNGYRAVRDDIFLKMTKNSLDSLNASKAEISKLGNTIKEKNTEIAGLNKNLTDTKKELEDAVKNRDSLVFFGIPMTKSLYNLVVWGIILGLLALLVFGWLIFSRNNAVNRQTKKDLEETREEFEIFRKSAREKNEQMVLNHFNEIKKLKEGRG